MVTNIRTTSPRLTIILHSGAYDRVCYALWTSLAALSSGMEAHMLLTFEGLRRFTRNNINKLDDETPVTVHDDIKFGLEAGVVQ
ncbi:MAG: hypothetical protein HY673_03490, partial [Chloroflexi bacterium]|nr:hypothetical protein [Chloroflexota bacterium]